MATAPVLLVARQALPHGELVTLTLNRPHKLNSLTADLISALVAAIDKESAAAAAPSAEGGGTCLPRVLAICGAGRGFSAGVDLTAATSLFSMEAEDASGAFPRLFDVPAALRACPWPVLALVHGACYTGALEIALCADVLLATPDALFADTHAGVGIAPSWGLSQRLQRRIGIHRALEMSLTATPIDAARADSWGLCNRVVPSGDLHAEAVAMATNILEAWAPMVRGYKRTARDGSELALGPALRLEREHALRYYQHMAAEDDAYGRLMRFLATKKGRGAARARL